MSGWHDHELERPVTVQRQRPGDSYVRIRRQDLGSFRIRRGRLVATERADEAAGAAAVWLDRLRDLVTGRPLDTEAQDAERLPVVRALPVLSSDALSSVAYGPEAGLAVLAAAGGAALLANVPIAIAVALLMVVVTTSYRQVVMGYQGGGGSYAVASANLGVAFGLVAAAALLTDYVLTVAVSVSSGVDALASAFPALFGARVAIAVLLVALIAVGNLRGVREAGALFAGPTYLFIAAIGALILVGLVRGLLFGAAAHPGRYPPLPAEQALTPLLLLTAFASGCSSMTGIEAISNSVPSFRPPQARNAARTLVLLGGILVGLFLGVVALDVLYGVAPHPGGNPTVLSELAAVTFSGGLRPFYYLVQFATLVVLVMAANTSFNGFPRLGAILARDNFLPHRLGHLGSRLVYSTSILFLALFAAVLIVAFQADTDALINLFALGVFTAFTLAQAGMARHWWRQRGRGWGARAAINGVGAAVSALVDAVIIITKTPRGAWVVLVLVPFLVVMFWATGRFYAGVRRQLSSTAAQPQEVELGPILIPAWRCDRQTLAATRYALTLGGKVTVIHMARNGAEAGRLRREWAAFAWSGPEPAVRTVVARRRLRAFLHELDRIGGGGATVTVVMPEWRPDRLWEDAIRRPRVALLKLALRRRPVVAASIPVAVAGVGAERVALVPIVDLWAPARRALAYARAIADRVIAIHVVTDVGHSEPDEVRLGSEFAAWAESQPGGVPMKLVQIDSPYRSVVPPLLAYVDAWRRSHPDPVCTVVLPELSDRRWWSWLLYDHRAFWIKAALLERATVATADVTYQLG
jgi:amino acid transporter